MMMTTTAISRFSVLIIVLCGSSVHAFTVHSPRILQQQQQRQLGWKKLASRHSSLLNQHRLQRDRVTQRCMYNFPPPNNNNNNNNSLGSIVRSVLSLVGLVWFLSSPLGGVVFALANTVLGLLFLTPVLLFVAFQTWQFFNTFTGPCPNCGAPQRVAKNSSPTICLNCGTFIQAKPDGSGIDLVGSVNGSSDYYNNDNPFGAGNSVFGSTSILDDIFANPSVGGGGMSKPQQQQDKAKKFQREQTIIDVEIEDEEDNDDDNVVTA